jgi:tetratricopeptide (TPR) repeat protein
MLLRRSWLFPWILCLGCHTLPGPEKQPSASSLWERGEAAMSQGQPQEAIRCYEQSLAIDDTPAATHLSLAAAFLEAGREEAACAQLAGYLARHPEQLKIRAVYGELLLKLDRITQARAQWQRLIEDAQREGSQARMHLLLGHSRLMELADAHADEYGVHLHRGIGLYWLARQRAELPEADGELPAAGLFWQSASELKQAHRLRPSEARPCWYLYSVWFGLGQHQLAARFLGLAEANVGCSYLSAAEQHGLLVALRVAGKGV